MPFRRKKPSRIEIATTTTRRRRKCRGIIRTRRTILAHPRCRRRPRLNRHPGRELLPPSYHYCSNTVEGPVSVHRNTSTRRNYHHPAIVQFHPWKRNRKSTTPRMMLIRTIIINDINNASVNWIRKMMMGWWCRRWWHHRWSSSICSHHGCWLPFWSVWLWWLIYWNNTSLWIRMVRRIRPVKMISLLLLMIPPVMITRTVQRSYLHGVLLLIIIKFNTNS